MDIAQERQAIKNAKAIYLAHDGIKAKLTKSAANELLFEAKGYVIQYVGTAHMVIENINNCRIR